MNSCHVLRIATCIVVMAAVATPSRTASAQGLPSDSASTLRLTLEDAVRRAVDHNPDLAIVRLDRETALMRVAESRGAFVPLFSTTLGRSGDVTPPSNTLFGERGVMVNDWFSSTGVRQRLPWGGGTWNVSWDASRSTTNNPLSSFQPSLGSGIELAFSQPLLKDRTVDEARHQYVIARRNQQTSELRFRESVVQTVAAVKQAYWTLKATMANVTVQQRSLELAQELVRQNKARVDLGQAPPLDLLQAEAEVAQRRENLIQANAAAGDAGDRLRRLIMDPGDSAFWHMYIDPVDEPTGGNPSPDVEAAVAGVSNARLDVAQARNELANAESTVAFYSNQRLPDIRLETSYRGNGLSGTQFLRSGGFPGVINGQLRRGFGSAIDQMFSHEYSTWSFGLNVSYPLGGSYEEAGAARAGFERRQAAQRIASLQLEATEAIRQAGRQVRSTAERIDAARAGATLAEQRLDTEQRRFEVGLSTSFLVTQAQRDQVQAQVNLLQATLDHQSSLVNFEAVQQAPPLTSGQTIALSGPDVVLMPPSAPRGVFRQGSATGLQ